MLPKIVLNDTTHGLIRCILVFAILLYWELFFNGVGAVAIGFCRCKGWVTGEGEGGMEGVGDIEWWRLHT